MANFSNFSNKISTMMKSPKTKEMINKAKVAANKPENRAKLKHLQSKITSRGRGHHDNRPGPGAGGVGPDTHGGAYNPGDPGGGYGAGEPGGRSGSTY